MSNIAFIDCLEEIDISKLERGDQVLLKSEDDGSPYTLKVVVASTSPDTIEGYVDAIYDGHNPDYQITDGAMLDSLAGYEVFFKPSHIHKLMKRSL